MFLFQIRVLASDGGDPPQSATTTVNVVVRRNLYPPVFSPRRIELNIYENARLGVTIATVNATDRDTKVG